MATLLKPTRIDAIGFVDKGANPECEIMIWKRAGEPGTVGRRGAGPMQALLGAIGKRLGWSADEVAAVEKDAETFAEVRGRDDMLAVRREIEHAAEQLCDSLVSAAYEADDEQDPAALAGTSLEQFAAWFSGRVPTWRGQIAGQEADMGKQDTGSAGDRAQGEGAIMGVLRRMGKALGLSDEQIEQVEQGKEAAADEGAGSASGPAATADVSADDISKRFANLAKRAAAAEKRAEQAEQAASHERELRETAELRKRAESEFASLPGDVDEKVEQLRAIGALPEEQRKRTEQALKSAAEQLRQSQLFGAFGSDHAEGAGAGSAWAKMESAAREIMAKSDGPLDFAAALQRATRAHPDLAREYEREMRPDA